jgi:hypothetical protein
MRSPILINWKEDIIRVKIMDLRFWKSKEEKQVERIKGLLLKIRALDPDKEEDYKKIKQYQSEVDKMGKVMLKDGKLVKVEDIPPQQAQQQPNMPGMSPAPAFQPDIEQEMMEEQEMPIPPVPVNVMRPIQPSVQPSLAQQQAAYQQQAMYAAQQQQQEALRQQQQIALQQQMVRQQQMALQQQQFQEAQQPQQDVIVRIMRVNGALDVSVNMVNIENFLKNVKEAIDSQSSFEIGNRILNGRHIIDLMINPE